MDGYVTIGTKIDTTGIDKGISELQKKLQKLKEKATVETNEITGVSVVSDNLTSEEQKYYDRLQASLDKLQLKKARLLQQDNQITEAVQEQAIAQEDVTNNVNQWVNGVMTLSDGTRVVKKDVNEMSESISKSDFSKMQLSVEGVGKSIQKATKRLTKMALAVFGIRSAFMFVRNSINTIAQGDKQLSDDIQYIRIALAYTIEPIVRGIVNLAKQLMFYVGYIVKAWTGKNIFANANKGLENANKQAKGLNKELNKTTASFDEMNTLSSNGSGSDNAITPSFDFGDIENQPVPEWLEWIADNGDLIIDILAGITAGLVALKLGFTGIQALGIGIAVAGLARTIQKIIDFIKKPTFKNFMGILEGIAITVAGIAVAFTAWPVAIGAAIALIVIELVNHFDEVKKMFGKIVDWIDKDFRGMLVKIFGPLGNLIADPFIWAVNYISTLFNGLFGGIKQIINGIILLLKGDFKGGISEIFSGMLDILMAPFNAMAQLVQEVFNGVCNVIIDAINWIIRQLNKIHFKLPGWIPGIGGKSFGIDLEELPRLGETKAPKAKKGGFWDNLIKNIPKLAVGGVINQPGRGVPLTSAIGGERGAEGVIPLTDSQQMALLGETIGRYVNISATIPVYVGNRKVAREVRKIQANEDFAFNR